MKLAVSSAVESPPAKTSIVVVSITAGREEYALEPYLNAPLHEVDAVEYRHEVL